jgi:CheY-like chemotaxis protein
MKQINNLVIIDDDDIYLFLTRKAISESNIPVTITTFSNGKDAIEFLKSTCSIKELLPEVIFLDLTMPVMDGWGFLEEYSRIQESLAKQIRIYVVSSSISPHDIERARSFEMVTDYIIKPVTRDMYLDIVKNLN